MLPLGDAGTPLEHFAGPDEWQRQELKEIGRQVRLRAFNGRDPVSPIRRAISSGHGIGKSALTAFIVLWLMSTRPGAQGTVTANTHTQLETKTWAAIQKWHKLCLTGPWFICTTGRLYHREQQGNLVLHAADVQGRELRSLRRAARRDLVLLLHL